MPAHWTASCDSQCVSKQKGAGLQKLVVALVEQRLHPVGGVLLPEAAKHLGLVPPLQGHHGPPLLDVHAVRHGQMLEAVWMLIWRTMRICEGVTCVGASAAAAAAAAAAPAPEPPEPAVPVHRLPPSAGTVAGGGLGLFRLPGGRPRFLGAALGSAAPEPAAAGTAATGSAGLGGGTVGRSPAGPGAARTGSGPGDFQQPRMLPPQPRAGAHPAFPLFLRKAIHLSGSRKMAKETLVPRVFTSLPSTSVRRKFSVRRVIGPRSSTRCPSSVWSFMTWPTPLSMITLQIMSLPNGQRLWAALPSSLDRR